MVSEKIDGTNASIYITTEEPRPDDTVTARITVGDATSFVVYTIRAGSRTRWIVPHDDNFGFARWVQENAEELIGLGVGHHFGEWWGKGIQRVYALDHRRFSLFNSERWEDRHTTSRREGVYPILTNGKTYAPLCCHVVPVLFKGPFNSLYIQDCVTNLERNGSLAAPGFHDPEGIVVYHTAAGNVFKKTLKDDQGGKEQAKADAEARAAKNEQRVYVKKVGDPNKLGRRKGCDGYEGPYRRKTDGQSLSGVDNITAKI